MNFNLRTIGLILLCIVTFCRCSDDNDETQKPSLTLEKSSLTATQGGETQTIKVTAVNTEWEISVPTGDQSWCTATAKEDVIEIKTTENASMSPRNTIITIVAKADASENKKIALGQFGREPAIFVDESSKDLEVDAGSFDVIVSSNIEYDITFDPADQAWLRKVDTPDPKSDGVTDKTIRFEYDKNTTPKNRDLKIKFAQVGGGVATEVAVKQDLYYDISGPEYNAKTPMMGWSSWNSFRININEELIKASADAMILKGLKAVGYNYLNVDDGFFWGRDENGKLVSHKEKFPNGMRVVSDHIHKRGLRAGIYSDAGNNTCGSIWDGDKYGIGVGFYGHEEQDAETFFKEWNFDFVKIDYCGAEKQGLVEKAQYNKIWDAILATGRTDIRMNICRWMFPGTWAAEIAGSWRVTHDIRNQFEGDLGVINVLEHNLYLSAYAGPGHFNDMDMMQIGRNTMSVDQEKSHFALWSIMCSPMLIGCDMRNIPDRTLQIITNKEVIALNQDPLGLQAQVVTREGTSGNRIVLAKQIEVANGKIRGVVLFNGEKTAATMRINFADVDLVGATKVRDLWSQTDLGSFNDYYEVSVPAHGTAVLRLEGASAVDKKVYEGENAYINLFNAINNGSNGRVSTKSTASGGRVLGWLGNSAENWAEFRNVYSTNGGNYEMVIYYHTAVARDLTVTVNGTEHSLPGLKAGTNENDWDTQATVSVNITLKKGNNVIRFSNPTGDAPDIDKFELKAK